METYTTLLFESADGVATITLHRPERLNAFTVHMHEELRHAFAAIEADRSVRAVVLTGSGRGFCAGQDLGERGAIDPAHPPDLGVGLDKNFNPLVRTIRKLDRPVVCAVNGVAAGAGANVALACDIVIAARSASFIQAFARIGLVPDCGGTWFLPRTVGSARAAALALLAEPLTAERAEAWGLIYKCVDDEALMGEARSLASHLATRPTRTLALIKLALQASSGNSLDGQLDLERDLQRVAGKTYDFSEGVRAFLEKREARFEGR